MRLTCHVLRDIRVSRRAVGRAVSRIAPMRKPKKSMNRQLADLANSLTGEQMMRLDEVFHGPAPREYDAMTDDELLAELGV